MAWNGEKQRELELFLARFTSPDAAAQQLNLQQLDALTHEQGALHALVSILASPSSDTSIGGYTVAQRTAAATTARELVRLNPSFLGVTDLSSLGTALFAALLAEPSSVVQTALSSLIASLARAECAQAPPPHQGPLEFLAALSDGISRVSSDVLTHLAAPSGMAQDTLTVRLSQVLATLRVVRILAEDGTSALRQAGLSAVRASLSAAFSSAFALLFFVSCTVPVQASASASSATSPVVTLSVQTLSTLAACVSAEWLTFVDDAPGTFTRPVAPTGEAPAAVWDAALQALSTVVLPLAASHSVTSGDQLEVCAVVLHPVWSFTSACVGAASLSPRALAPLLSMVVTAVQSFWTACTAATPSSREAWESHIDSDTVTSALLSSISCVADIVAQVGVDVSLIPALVAQLHALAQLPVPLAAELVQSYECDGTVVEEPSSVLAVLQRRQSKKSHHTEVLSVNDAGADGNADGGVSASEEGSGGAHDALGVLLPDGGARRQSLAWLLNCLAFAFPSQLTTTVVAPMVELACADLSAHTSDSALGAATRVEAALFVLSEVTEEVLSTWDGTASTAHPSDPGLLPLLGHLAAHVTGFLNRFLASRGDASMAVPFFVRVGCCRWLACLLSGVEQAMLNAATTSPASAAHVRELLAGLGGMPMLLEALHHLASAETSRAAQQACVQAMDVILCGALRRSPRDVFVPDGMHESSKNVDTTTSDSDEEILGDTEDKRGTASLAFQLGLLSSPNAALPPLFALLRGLSHDLLGGDHPSSSLAVRLDLYSLLSRVIPLLEAALGLPGGEVCVSTVLESVAQRYMVLQSLANSNDRLNGGERCASSPAQSELLVVESISLLNCLCDVGASVGQLLAPACVWIVQVCGSVLLDEQRGTRAPAYQQSVVTDAADRCMLALDLLSCACDALLDRDALICVEAHRTTSSKSRELREAASVAVATLTSLRQALAVSQDGHTLLSLTATVLEQTLHRKPQQGDDTEADLRRAAFGVLYDLVFLFSTDSSFGAPGVEPTMVVRPVEEGHAAVCGGVIGLCLRELDGLVQRSESGESVTDYVADSTALSNAMLCLGETLFFLTLEPVHEGVTRGPHAEVNASVGTVMAPFVPSCQRLLRVLIALLNDEDIFTVPVSVAQNAASAAAAIASALQALAAWGHPCALAGDDLSTVVRAVSAQSKHFKPSHDHEGAFECTQVLVCLGCALSSGPVPLNEPARVVPLGACLSLVLEGISGAGGIHTIGGTMIRCAWQSAVTDVAQSSVRWGKALSLAKQQKLQRFFSPT